jgi:RNA polymerase sigma-70 factor (ECF subfamily)
VEGRPLDDPLQVQQQALVRQALDGSVDAYQALVRGHEEVAFRVAILITGDATEAGDAASEAMVKAFYALDRFRADAPFRPWLLRIVANEARNRRRSSGRRARLADRVGRTSLRASGDAAPSPEDAVISAVEHQALFDAVRSLGERDREVVALRFFAELSEAETAAALGCAPGTAKSRLHRALVRLRQAMPAEAFDA